MKNTPFDMQILEELSNLEYFIVKSPVSSPEFWKEWQEKFSRAYMNKTAIKKLLRTKKLPYDEVSKHKSQMALYDDVLFYLETLKGIAMSIRGIASFDNTIEFDDEDIDLDF